MKIKIVKSILLILAIAALASAISLAIRPALLEQLHSRAVRFWNGRRDAAPAAVIMRLEPYPRGCWTEEHRWIIFGEYDGKPILWRILEIGETDDGDPLAFLLADRAVAEEMKFDDQISHTLSSNDWNSSSVKKWLNDDFYSAAFNEEERSAIITSAYRYGGKYENSDKAAASKIFLLSTEEALDSRFFANDADRRIGAGWWWLRSPGENVDMAAHVYYNGEVYGGGSYLYVDDGRAVRPALKINLASSIFTSSASASIYEILFSFKMKMLDTRPIGGAEVTADNPRQKYFTESDGVAEMKLRAGRQKIRVNTDGYEEKEIELDVEHGGGSHTLNSAQLTPLPPLPAADVPKDLKGAGGPCWTDVRRWIAFGEYNGEPILWRVLETGEGNGGSPAAFLLADRAVAGMSFGSSNDWESSSIKKWLNDDFYSGAFNEEERGAIITSVYRYGGEYENSGKTAASKIFLLSTEEALDSRFFTNDSDMIIGTDWWLRSPVNNGDHAANVSRGGGVNMHGPVDNEWAVRPALKINLASSVFMSASPKYEVLHPVKVKVLDEYAWLMGGVAVAADSPRQKYFTDIYGEVLMKLSAGKQNIRISAAGYKVREFTLDVKPGGSSVEVNM